jgi:predicted nuclease of predicted toxin-antitoxin system
MKRPTETALRGRARALLEVMTERARWIYAVPRDTGALHARAALEAAGLACEEEDRSAHVARYAKAGARARFVVFDSPELDVLFVEAEGEDAPPVLADVLEKTEFYAQSRLLGTALDVADPEAPKALRTLAHMVVAWDEDWTDLFLLHLASPDPVVRHEAVSALCLAAMVARDTAPALPLLEEARSREKFPKLKETMGEAIALLRGAGGGPVEIAP